MRKDLYGTVDEQLCTTVIFKQEWLALLEQKAVLHGLLRRPKNEGRAAHHAKKNSTPAEPTVNYVDVPMDIYLRSQFRMSGMPAHESFKSKLTYELWLTAEHIRKLRECGRLEYQNHLPCNRLVLSLENEVARPQG